MADNKDNLTGLINCLRNERVVIRHIPRENAMIGNNPKHVLSGGMAETAIKRYTVPQLRSGQLKDPLTKSEKDFLEDYMGLEPNALSVFRKVNNYWSNFQVELHKADNYLDLSSPDDYIKYKVLLLNDNIIAPSLSALQNYPKATYEFVIIHEEEEERASKRRLDSRKESYKEYGKIEEDWSSLRFVVESFTGKPFAGMTKLLTLQEKAMSYMDNDPKLFLKIVQDSLFRTKVMLRDAVDAGVVLNRAGQLYNAKTGEPLCENGESTLGAAATYLNQPKNSLLLNTLQAEVKEYKQKVKE